MKNFVSIAKHMVDSKKELNWIATSQLRKISSTLFQDVKHKSFDEILVLCEEFLEDCSSEMRIISFDWVYRIKNKYRKDTFVLFERWLKDYVRGWSDCDDFCTHALGEILCQYKSRFSHLVEWTKHEDFWVRRAAAVTLIRSFNTDRYSEFVPFIISDVLMHDKHYLVRKGCGWMLKVYSLKCQNKVYEYLIKNKEVMPRDVFRYAIEKMDINIKEKLMKRI